jgi:hypothetical protein
MKLHPNARHLSSAATRRRFSVNRNRRDARNLTFVVSFISFTSLTFFVSFPS